MPEDTVIVCNISFTGLSDSRRIEFFPVPDRCDSADVIFRSKHSFYSNIDFHVRLQWRKSYWNVQVNTPTIHPQILEDGRIWFNFKTISNQTNFRGTHISDLIQKIIDEPDFNDPFPSAIRWDNLDHIQKLIQDLHKLYSEKKWTPQLHHLMPKFLKEEILTTLYCLQAYRFPNEILDKIFDSIFKQYFLRNSEREWLRWIIKDLFIL